MLLFLHLFADYTFNYPAAYICWFGKLSGSSDGIRYWLGENTYWETAMDFEGAKGMCIARKLFELYPWYKMVPDQLVIAGGQGMGEDHKQAARAEDGSFILVYLTFGNTVSIHTDRISCYEVNAQWYNPRDGRFISIGTCSGTGIRDFTSPTSFDRDDWVLVLDKSFEK